MRIEIAACLLTISLALLVPESLLPPVANPLKRAAPARNAVVRAEPTQGNASARVLRESLIQGGETERVEFNKRNEPDRDARNENNGADSVDFSRLQNIW